MAFIENSTHSGRMLTSEQLNMYRDDDTGIQYVPLYVEADSAELEAITIEANSKGYVVVHANA